MTAPGQGAGRDDIFREVLKLQGLIRAVLRRYRVPAADLPDLVQDVLVAAYRRVDEGGFRPLDPTLPLAENVAAWVAGIARWTAIESNRARARQRKVFAHETRQHPVDADAIQVPSPEAQFLAKEALAVFARAKLSQEHRDVVALAAEGHTAREIGEMLGIPEDTASTRLKRARRAFHEALVRWRK